MPQGRVDPPQGWSEVQQEQPHGLEGHLQGLKGHVLPALYHSGLCGESYDSCDADDVHCDQQSCFVDDSVVHADQCIGSARPQNALELSALHLPPAQKWHLRTIWLQADYLQA